MEKRVTFMKKFILTVLCLIVTTALAGCGLFQEQNMQMSGRDETTKAGTLQSGTTEDEDAGDVSEGTDADGKTKKIRMKLYFPTADNSAVPFEEREVEVKDGAVMKAAVEALLGGPSDKNLRKAIPDGTRLIGINRKDHVAIVDFSKEYEHFGGSMAEIVARVSVVNTLTEFEGIDKVRILIEGKDLIGPSGEPLGEMGRFALDSKGFPLPGKMQTITLYFGNSNADKVVPEKREIQVIEGEPVEKYVFEELIKGPEQEGSRAIIPKGTKLLSAKTANGVCTLDLSHEFVDNHPGGSAGESMTLNSIVNSLTELSHIKKVRFLIGGKSREVYMHAIFNEPFSRNEEIIRK